MQSPATLRIPFVLLCFTCAGLSHAAEIPGGSPERAGMSRAALVQVDQVMQGFVEDHSVAGAVVGVVRKDKVVHLRAYGMRDRKGNKPMTRDTIFRIYSMTKAITTAAALMLYDEGRMGLDDPIGRYLPELRGLKVYTPAGLVTPHRAPTIRDLMRHTAGFTYGIFGDTPVDRLYRKANLLDRNDTLHGMVAKLGRLPLLYEPGTDWVYSVSADVLGYLIETVSGERFDDFLAERLFGPLDMKDTGFFVPREKLDRFATNYRFNGSGGLEPIDRPESSPFRTKPAFLSGGGGLVSTVRDYLRFLMMIQHHGAWDGVQLLRARTVERMTHNQVPPAAMPVAFGSEERIGVGFGLGFSVRVAESRWDPDGHLGEYGWGGAASTHDWVSPEDDLIVVTMEQIMPYSFRTEFALKGILYKAIQH